MICHSSRKGPRTAGSRRAILLSCACTRVPDRRKPVRRGIAAAGNPMMAYNTRDMLRGVATGDSEPVVKAC